MEFFVEKKIRIYQGERSTTLTLRPLLIKEVPALIRLMDELEEMDPADQVAAQIALLRPCITPAGFFDTLPAAEVLPVILDTFFDFNFPGASKSSRQADKPRPAVGDREFAAGIEFLISQGHKYGEIQEYTLIQFSLFQELALERLTGTRKKKVDPLAALAAAGVPIGKQ